MQRRLGNAEAVAVCGSTELIHAAGLADVHKTDAVLLHSAAEVSGNAKLEQADVRRPRLFDAAAADEHIKIHAGTPGVQCQIFFLLPHDFADQSHRCAADQGTAYRDLGAVGDLRDRIVDRNKLASSLLHSQYLISFVSAQLPSDQGTEAVQK